MDVLLIMTGILHSARPTQRGSKPANLEVRMYHREPTVTRRDVGQEPFLAPGLACTTSFCPQVTSNMGCLGAIANLCIGPENGVVIFRPGTCQESRASCTVAINQPLAGEDSSVLLARSVLRRL